MRMVTCPKEEVATGADADNFFNHEQRRSITANSYASSTKIELHRSGNNIPSIHPGAMIDSAEKGWLIDDELLSAGRPDCDSADCNPDAPIITVMELQRGDNKHASFDPNAMIEANYREQGGLLTDNLLATAELFCAQIAEINENCSPEIFEEGREAYDVQSCTELCSEEPVENGQRASGSTDVLLNNHDEPEGEENCSSEGFVPGSCEESSSEESEDERTPREAEVAVQEKSEATTSNKKNWYYWSH